MVKSSDVWPGHVARTVCAVAKRLRDLEHLIPKGFPSTLPSVGRTSDTRTKVAADLVATRLPLFVLTDHGFGIHACVNAERNEHILLVVDSLFELAIDELADAPLAASRRWCMT
jgi:hypothetical protein